MKLELAQMNLMHGQDPAIKNSLSRTSLLALTALDTCHHAAGFFCPWSARY